jgi:hypothetical protein
LGKATELLQPAPKTSARLYFGGAPAGLLATKLGGEKTKAGFPEEGSGARP